MHGNLGVVGASLDDDVTTPARRVEVVAEEGRELTQRLWPPVGEAEPVVEEGGSVADGHGEVTRGQVERLPGVLGDVPRPATDDTARRRLGTVGHPLGRPGPPGQQIPQLARVVGDDVECDEVQPVLRGGGDAGLVLAPKRYEAVVDGGGVPSAAAARLAGGIRQPGGRTG